MNTWCRLFAPLGLACTISLAAGVGLLATPPASAQGEGLPAGEALPAAKALFERHVEAAGGWEAFRKQKNRVMHGSFTSNQPGAPRLLLTIWAAAPDRIRVEIDEPGVGKTVRAFDGKVGWETNRAGVTVIYEGDELSDFRETAFYNGEADYEKLYASYETIGRVNIGDRPAYHVKAVSPTGKESAVYFDVATGLATAKATTLKSERGNELIRALFQDYRETEGLKFPMRVVQAMGQTEWRVQYSRIDVNADESKFPSFSPPPGAIAPNAPPAGN